MQLFTIHDKKVNGNLDDIFFLKFDTIIERGNARYPLECTYSRIAFRLILVHSKDRANLGD